jgi:N6-adenosine-specific RNA methylase IME4
MSGYRTIVADPPWRYKTTMAVTGNAPGRTRQHGRSGSAIEYPTMSVEEIAAMPVNSLLHPEGAHLYLWTTNTHIEQAWGVSRAWGFEPKNLLTWCKRPKGMIGFGAFSQSTEFILFASSARRAIHTSRCNTTWFEWPRTLAHSRKPEALQELVERISPGPYLELFARRRRYGWDVWGDEAPTEQASQAEMGLAL